MLRLVLSLAIAVAWSLCGASAQGAATAPSRAMADGGRPSMSVDVGWSGRTVAGRWTPIRVTIVGGDRASAGVVVVRSGGHEHPPLVVEAPFVATPGKRTPVDLAAPLGAWILDLEVSLLDERGRRMQRLTFNLAGQGGGVPLQPPLSAEGRLIVCVGASSLAEASRVVAGRGASEGNETSAAEALLRSAEVVSLRPQELPTLWAAYESLSALVLDGEAMEEASDGARDAVRTWVESGGRLVLLAETPGTAHLRWLAPGLIDVGAMVRPGDSAPAIRPVRLLERGREAGWLVSNGPGGAPAAGGWFAEGPMGLGWVVALGADPARLEGGGEAGRAAWDGALQRATMFEAAPTTGAGALWRAVWTQSAALQAVFDSLAEDLGAVVFPFWIIVVFLIALAIALGPVDRFVLRRMGRLHRSWLTALAWIGVFSAVAYAAPLALRSGATQARRVTMLDAVPSEGVAVRGGALAVFPGRTERASMRTDVDGAWWRPVSAALMLSARVAAVRASQREGACTPSSLTLRVWSLTTLVDEAPAPSPFDATVEGVEGAWRVRITGVGERRISRAALLAADGWRALERRAGAEEEGVWIGEASGAAAARAAWWRSAKDELADRAQPWARGASSREPRHALGLPGAMRRTGPMERRVATGKWTVVCFEYEEDGMDIDLGDEVEGGARRLVRLLTPFDGIAARAGDGSESRKEEGGP